MLDQTIQLLFEDSFPREVGRKRYLCRSETEFEQQIDLLNGAEEVFTNVNPLDGSINKIFIDFDGQDSLVEAQQVYTYCLSYSIPCIPVASGKKGIHLYLLLKTRKGEDNKEILYKTTKSILLKALPNSKSIDSHVIGDTRRLCRIPNTLRPPENMSYCTFIPPSKAFLEMKNQDLNWYIKGTHTYPLEDYHLKNLPTFEELILPEVDNEQLHFANLDNSPSVKYVDNEHLKMLLKPCLYRLITVEEPRHHVRVAATVDLLKADMNPNQIVELFRQLKWRDWDETWTRYQLAHIKQIAYSKKKLQQLGICFNCGRSCF